MKFFVTSYRLLAPRRKALFLCSLLLLALSVVLFSRIETREDIEAMLPDGGSDAAVDFRLLQQAPFARKLVIDLAAGSEVDSATLLQATDRLAAALTPPEFSRAVSGPGSGLGGSLFAWMSGALPLLCDAADVAALEEQLDAATVRERVRQAYGQLLSAEGMALKGLLRRDPLQLRDLGFAKLRHLSLIPQVRLESGHFLSADGKHALIVAETPVAMTDSAGSAALLAHFEELVAANLPAGVSATLVSGHRYTLANAAAIKGDLALILSCSSLAILGLFLAYLRNWRAGFVFLLPVSVLCFAAVAVSWFYPTVSAVTIGFGAVLLGITIDYGLHVYFALGRSRLERAETVGAVARPVLFGGLTTLAAFGVLIWSDLPGQRQLAVFAMAGIGLSLLLALTLLPHLLPNRLAGSPPVGMAVRPGQRRRRWVVWLWLGGCLLCLWPASRIHFNGDLRTLSLVPPELRRAEGLLREVWGDVRGKAMIFVEGASLEEALAANERLFDDLAGHPELGPAVSLAPLLPSAARQQAHAAAWSGYWQGPRGQAALTALQQEGAALGFAPTAFAPFLQLVAETPAPLTLESLRQAGLGDAVDVLLATRDGGRVRILTLVPDSPALLALFGDAATRPQGARLVSQGRFGREVGSAIARDFRRFFSLAAGAVVLLLILLFHQAHKVVFALLPVATGLLVMFGVMGGLGIDFTLFNVIAASLTLGLGVDYGIFMVCKLEEGFDHATERAVLVSGLTTLAGFGALVLARHPALHSIGLTVLLGIGAAIPTALLVVPALYRRRGGP